MIKDVGAKKIGEVLRENKNLRSLGLEYNYMGDVGAGYIAEALEINTMLQVLNLGYNEIGPAGGVAIARALERNTTLLQLDLSDNKINGVGIQRISESLAANTSLLDLCWNGNNFDSEDAEYLGTGLAASTSLQILSLNRNWLVAKQIVAGLAVNKSLQTLKLRRILIRKPDAEEIAKALCANKTLRILDLEGNSLTAEGVAPIAEALHENNTLQTLILSRNNISDTGAERIAKSLRVNMSLQNLNLCANAIGDAGAKGIGDSLTANSTLQRLNLFGNKIGDAGAERIAESLRTNTSLQWLSLDRNNISANAASAFRNAIQDNKDCSLIKLALGGSRIGKEVQDEIEEKAKTRFLDALTSERSAPLNRLRLMFVGQGKAGKSETVRSLLGKPFHRDWDSTVGADVSEGMTANRQWVRPDPKGDFTSKFAARLMLMKGNEVSRKKGNGRKQERSISMSKKIFIDRVLSTVGEPVLTHPNRNENPESDLLLTAESVRNRYGSISISEDDVTGAIFDNEGSFESHIIREYDENLIIDAKRDTDALTFSLWDFGGQEVFYSMHHIFLRKTGVYILVFDMREILDPSTNNEAIRYLLFWMRSIKLHALNAPLILVGTFLAEVTEIRRNLHIIDKTLRELVKTSFPRIAPPEDVGNSDNLIYFAIDNKERMGIDQLRQSVERNARKDASCSQDVSVRWMAFLDSILLKRSERPYLTVSEDVHSLGMNVGISSLHEQEEALSFFHELGLVIHMTSTEILKNVVIIKPEWLIDALSKVICDRDIHIDLDEIKFVGLEEEAHMTYERGLTSRDFLEYIWRGEEVEFFIDIMKQAMLLSEWNRELYLIPSLLRNTLVLPENDIPGHRCVFDFSVSFLPNGVFQRLFCLCIEHSSRHGAGRDQNEKLFGNFCSTKIDSNGSVHLLENKEAQSIYVYVEEADSSGKILTIIQSMLKKVNDDVMGAGLSWNTYVENGATKELVRLNEARQQNLPPWFNPGNLQNSKMSASKNLHLDNFLENL
eukprot:CAMPEP_0204826224 /NCGR_PEP_ID=MMETSP1346-20131115/3952_1 /ASSEMBLY_ACC=CAM_ASM_000771 /TAXON_ID=215587 /ORGANISM="Aplanochytrium stocchinoi, Strain GSBS06" /LENGTH=1008 /DNA_ID=CAMNT_0051954139 /DNA_START=998 /DNA_END=4024 /DNA_ORIENTATION=+